MMGKIKELSLKTLLLQNILMNTYFYLLYIYIITNSCFISASGHTLVKVSCSDHFSTQHNLRHSIYSCSSLTEMQISVVRLVWAACRFMWNGHGMVEEPCFSL